MALAWVHAVAVRCDYCDYQPIRMMRLDWEEAACHARGHGWLVEEQSGECACPDCLATMAAMPLPHPDTIVQLTDPLPQEEGQR